MDKKLLELLKNEKDGLTSFELSQKLNIGRQSATGLISQLKMKKFVENGEKIEDGQLYVITERGKSVLEQNEKTPILKQESSNDAPESALAQTEPLVTEIEDFETRVNPNQRHAIEDFEIANMKKSNTSEKIDEIEVKPYPFVTDFEIEHQHIIPKNKQDNINKASRYNTGDIECIDAIKASMSKEAFLGFCKGNIQKYCWRYEHKGGVESLEKAQWYLNKMIMELR